jgi:hypothetical protein
LPGKYTGVSLSETLTPAGNRLPIKSYAAFNGLSIVRATQAHQTIWNGNGGRVIFYQSEMPYDPPSQEAWQSKDGDGFASYKVGENVKTHEACGLGVYHVFRGAPVVAENAFQTPIGPGIKMQNMVTFRLGGGKPGSGIRHVINGKGGSVVDGQKATVDLF